MSVIIFIIILGVLIFVHELGHFLIAKKSGIRVDEFAIGFPPRIFSITKNGTKYSLNLIPFGGYVKIFGENPDDESNDPNRKDSFVNKPRSTQAAVLVGGVLFNIVFAWILISISLMSGFPSIVTDENRDKIKESFVSVTGVFENSPADNAGIKPGDQIVKMVSGDTVVDLEQITIEKVQEIISTSENGLSLFLTSASGEREVFVKPEPGVIGENLAIGVSMDRIGKMKLPFFRAISHSYLMTGQLIRDIAIGLVSLVGEAVSGRASFDNVAGPVGIVKIVGDAANFGFYYLLGFTAFISINLAVLNIFPFPALDGGRLVVVFIESIIRKQLKPKVVNIVNAAGFILLILLMLVITFNDIARLFS